MKLRWCTLLLLLVAAIPVAGAHTLSVAHLDIEQARDGTARLELDLAIRDLALTFPLDADRNEQVTWGELLAVRGDIERWVAARVALSAGASRCELAPVGLAIRRYDGSAYASLRLDARCTRGAPLEVDYRLFFDRDPQHRALVTLRRGEATWTAIARSDASRMRLGTADGATATTFLREGVHHILAGYDHLAFLLSLLLTAALLRRQGAWVPVAGARAAIVHAVGIVTAFTVAHSVTLALAALGLVSPASRGVEIAIAASVLLAALNNVWPVVTTRMWAVGFAFGLVHGFGFAGALGELGLPRGERLLALLSFNLGVELGQLAVVAATLPLLFALRRRAWYARWAMPALSFAIAVAAVIWLVQRL